MEARGEHRLPSGLVGLVVGAAALSAVIAAAVAWGDRERFLTIVSDAAPAWLLVGALLQAGTYAMPACGWWVVLRRAGRDASVARLYGLALVQLFTNQALPVGGLAGLVVVLGGLDRRGVPRPVGVAAMLVDQLGYLASYNLSVVLAVAWFASRGIVPNVMVALGALALLVGIAIAVGLLWLTTPGHELPPWLARLPRLSEASTTLLVADQTLVHDPALLTAAATLRMGNVALDAATSWVCLLAVGYELGFADAAAAFVFASLGRSFGMVPGGLGTYEGSAIVGLLLLGVPVEPALAATLLFRLLSFWLPMAPGLLLGSRITR